MQPLADGSLVEQAANLAVPGLKAKILVDHQPHAMHRCRANDRPSGCEIRRQRLLANDWQPAAGCGRDQLQVRSGGRNDIDKVEIIAGQGGLWITQRIPDAMLCR